MKSVRKSMIHSDGVTEKERERGTMNEIESVSMKAIDRNFEQIFRYDVDELKCVL